MVENRSHEEVLLDKHNKDYSIWIHEGDKVEKYNDCRILKLDEVGITFMDNKKIGKSKVSFVPMYKVVKIQQEFI